VALEGDREVEVAQVEGGERIVAAEFLLEEGELGVGEAAGEGALNEVVPVGFHAVSSERVVR
jgi:hypothetical protein